MERLPDVVRVVEHQSNQDALFDPQTPREKVFSAAIRHLHAVIEGDDMTAQRAKKLYWDVKEEI